jgi:hypothetical protein
MESQHHFIKALQHTYITKIPKRNREEHAKQEQWFDSRLSNTVHG